MTLLDFLMTHKHLDSLFSIEVYWMVNAEIYHRNICDACNSDQPYKSYTEMTFHELSPFLKHEVVCQTQGVHNGHKLFMLVISDDDNYKNLIGTLADDIF